MRTNIMTLLLAALSIPAALVPVVPRSLRAEDLTATRATVPTTALRMNILGERGGVLEGDHSIEIFGWSHEVLSPRDAASELPLELQHHSLFRFTKRIDKATPLLARCLAHNEVIPSVELRVPQTAPSADGTTQHYFTIELYSAHIAGIETEGAAVMGSDGNMKHEVREHVSFVFEKIVWSWTDGSDQFETESSLAVPMLDLFGLSDAPETPEGFAAGESTGTAAGGNCSNVCNEVAACCICKCFEENSWPFNYGCAAGCLVLDTVLGEDDEDDAFVFASPDGTSPLSEPLLVDRRDGDSVLVEAGVFSPRREAFLADSRVSRVYFEAVDKDSYLEEATGGAPARWSFAGSGEPTGSSHVADLSIRGMSAGPHLVRAVFVLEDGSTSEAMAILEIR